MFTPEQHAVEVHNELTGAVHNLNKKSKKKLLTAMAAALRKLATADNNRPQRVGEVPTSEGESPAQRVDEAPPITTTTNPTAPRTMQVAPRTHQRITRNNTPMATPDIVRMKDGFLTAYWSTAQLNDRQAVIFMMSTLNIFVLLWYILTQEKQLHSTKN